MRRITGLVLIVVLTILASLVETARNNLWTSYRDYNSPYLADLPAGSLRPPIAQRMVLVLVRGLRLDPSRQMPTLNELRTRGSDVVVQHEAPTYRLPAWETLLSGARAETHGMTTNFAPTARTSGPNNLFNSLQLVGQASALVGSQEIGDVFSGDVQRFEVVDNADTATRDDDAIRLAQDVLRDTANPVRLVSVELTAIEDTIQNNPANNQAALSVTDGRIKTLLDSLDLSKDVLVVLSDRGLTARGTDGGAEPEVAQTPLIMVGTGVEPASQAFIKVNDVAPTLSALLGVPMPVYSQGQVAIPVLSLPASAAEVPLSPTETLSDTAIITDTLAPLPGVLWASALQLTTFYENWSEVIHQPRFAAELLRAQQQDIRSGDTNAYQKFLIDLNARANAAAQSRLSAERSQRLLVSIVVGLFLLALVGLVISFRRVQAVLGAVAFAVLWYAFFFIILGDSFSLSMFAGSDPAPLMVVLQRYSAALMVFVCLIVAFTTENHEDGLEAITTVMSTVLLILIIMALQVVWFYFQWGNTFTWALPDSSALVVALLALNQISALSVRIVPELPNLPVPLLIGFVTLAAYGLVHGRKRPGRYGRFR